MPRAADPLPVILNAIPQGAMLIAADGTIRCANKAVEKIISSENCALAGKNCADLFADDFFGFSLKRSLSDKKIPEERKKTAVFVNKDLLLILGDNDISHAFDDMTSFIAHDIKNPLGAILGFAKLLRKDLEKDPEKLKFVDYIIKGANNINLFLDTLRSIYKTVDAQTRKIDLSTLLAETGVKKGAELFVEANPQMLRQAVSSLLDYCAKHSKTAPEIEIHDDGAFAYITVSCEAEKPLLADFINNYRNFYPKKGSMELAAIHKNIIAQKGWLITESANGKINFVIKLTKSGKIEA